MPTRLWAPWRMEYLLNHGRTPGCFLCEHPNDTSGFRDNLVIVVQPHAFVCLNRYPFTTGHLLVAPRRHVAELAELDDEEYRGLMSLLRDVTVRLKRALSCGGMNVGFNLGRAAGASFAEHVHGHVVPRWEGDTNFMPVIADLRVMPEHLDSAWRRLFADFADLPGLRAPPPEPQ